MAKRKSSIFISYVLRDKGDGDHIIESIQRRRPDVYVSSHFDLSIAEPWVDIVRERISECDLFIVLLTPNSVGSNNVLTEVGAAWGLDKPIVAVVTEEYMADALPISLYYSSILRIEDLDKAETLDRLLQHYAGVHGPESLVESMS
jgi:hypothetical protein